MINAVKEAFIIEKNLTKKDVIRVNNELEELSRCVLKRKKALKDLNIIYSKDRAKIKEEVLVLEFTEAATSFIKAKIKEVEVLDDKIKKIIDKINNKLNV